MARRTFGASLKHAWNAFRDTERKPREPRPGMAYQGFYGGNSSGSSRTRMTITNERSIIASIYTRMAIDAASIDIRHARKDKNNRLTAIIQSGLQECFTVSANLDQGASQFRQDIFATMFDKGVLAIVPTDVDVDPAQTSGYDIKKLRVGLIVDWYPQSVLVSVYDENDGKRKEIEFSKKFVAIVENPFHAVMNEPNSTLQRLIRKLNLLDSVDEAAGSGKLDIIIQLPYTIKTDTKREEAEARREQIDLQLKNSRYGIAYTDGSEKITQLNRPSENNMLKQIEYLMNQLYSQLGTNKEVFEGTASEEQMLNYNNRTIEAVVRAVTEAVTRTFFTKTARSQGQAMVAFRDPFKLLPISQIGPIADKLLRNEIATPNEIRSLVGWLPSDDPKSDVLMNRNMPQADPAVADAEEPVELVQIRERKEISQNGR